MQIWLGPYPLFPPADWVYLHWFQAIHISSTLLIYNHWYDKWLGLVEIGIPCLFCLHQADFWVMCGDTFGLTPIHSDTYPFFTLRSCVFGWRLQEFHHISLIHPMSHCKYDKWSDMVSNHFILNWLIFMCFFQSLKSQDSVVQNLITVITFWVRKIPY